MSKFFRRKKFCRFTAEGVAEIDYKDLNLLRQYITETGKIVPSLPSPCSTHVSFRCFPTATAIDLIPDPSQSGSIRTAQAAPAKAGANELE